MNTRRAGISGIALLALAGCGSLSPPKYENGEYVPPAAEHPLQISFEDSICGTANKNRTFGAAIAAAVVPVLVNQAYTRVVNWLDSKQANLSASSSGVVTTTFYTDNDDTIAKGCLVLKRGDSLEARFSVQPVGATPYWSMTPYSLTFKRSEAKEGNTDSKSLVAEISFGAPGNDGKLVTFFQATFDLGKRSAGGSWTVGGGSAPFAGQDSGPFPLPRGAEDKSGKKLNEYLAMKVTASVAEHGEGRDWIRGVTDALREKENRQAIVQPIIDALIGQKETKK